MSEQEQTYDEGRARNLEALLRALAERIRELDRQDRLLEDAGELMRLIGDVRSELFHYEVRITYDTPEIAEHRRIVREAQETDKSTWQASEWTPPPPPASGRGRKQGAVKASKQSTSNRAFYLLIAAVAVGGIAWLTYQSTRSTDVVQTSPIDTTLPKVESQGYVLGTPTARLEVTEFGDFECPACGHFSTITEPDIRKKFVGSGLVRWRFIDYPLSVHRNTWQASRAAACADEQGRFWAFHDYLYQTQDQWNGEVTDNPDKFMKQAGRQLGLDASKFDQCVDSKKYQAKIQAHLALGDARKINSTPTFIIGSTQVTRVLTYDQMAKIINDELAKAPAAPASGGDTTNSVPLPTTKKPG